MVESHIKSIMDRLNGSKKMIKELVASNESLRENNGSLQATIERLQSTIETQEKEIEKWKRMANAGKELLLKSSHWCKNKKVVQETIKEKDSENLNSSSSCSSSSSQEIKSLKKAVEKLSADIKKIETSLLYTPSERPLPDFYI